MLVAGGGHWISKISSNVTLRDRHASAVLPGVSCLISWIHAGPPLPLW